MAHPHTGETGNNILKAYISGFVLSLILTVVAFLIVIKKLLSVQYLYIALTVLVLIQLIVQVRCFLRLHSNKADKQWNIIALIFTIIVAAVIVIGSLWIMYNLNYNMMP